MRIDGDWLNAAPTQAVFAMLTEGGHRALAVGGCVRNAALGAPVADVDLATDARPERVMALAGAAGLKAVPTGIDHGTITVVADGIPHEVTTFRRDVATDGRHATVAFSDDVAEDAARRDFTMNALYAAADGTVIDPLDGLPDLRARRVRFIGDPAARIAEDYLRILRFFRFTAWYGDPDHGIDADGLAASAAAGDGIDRLSAERIGHEMRRLLAAPDPAPSVAAMGQAGLLWRVLPGAGPAALPVLVHLEDAPSDWTVRLATLGGDMDRLRLSNAEARTVAALSRAARDGDSAFALGDDLGAARARDALLIRAALTARPLDRAEIAAAEAGAAATFPLAAADLMPDLSGRALGDGLAQARRLWRTRAGQVLPEALRDAALRAARD